MIRVAYGCLGSEELAAVEDVFKDGYFGLSPRVAEFEAAIDGYLDSTESIAVSSGTAAMHLALDAIGIGPGDEVIVPSMTFIGSFQAITQTGATPVPCEVYPETLLIDIEDVKRKITPQTKAIMPVHYAGNPCDMDALLELKDERGIRIVEDAAHAFGTVYRGRDGSPYTGKKIGTFGDITCFSFDSIKVITCGEGGAVICNDYATGDGLRRYMRKKRLLGINRSSHCAHWKERAWSFDVDTTGFRYHMSAINAAIGLAQIKKLDAFIARRREICGHYVEGLKAVQGLELLRIDYDHVSPFMFTIKVQGDRRDDLITFLKDKEIETGISYVPNHHHSLYESGASLPVTDEVFTEILSLPLHCALSDKDVGFVVKTITEFFEDS